MFQISFAFIQHGTSPNRRLFRMTPFELFECPITMSREELIQEILLFLRENVANYLSQNNIQLLASEIRSYDQEATTQHHHHRLIPLNVYLHVHTSSIQDLLSLSFHPQTTALSAANEYTIHAEIYHPTEISINHLLSSDHDESTEINQVLEQSMQQLFIVPATEKVIASSLKKMELSKDEMKTSQCSICLESFDDDDSDEDVSALPCDHFFHNNCIVRWLKTGHTCPLCRFQLPVE